MHTRAVGCYGYTFNSVAIAWSQQWPLYLTQIPGDFSDVLQLAYIYAQACTSQVTNKLHAYKSIVFIGVSVLILDWNLHNTSELYFSFFWEPNRLYNLSFATLNHIPETHSDASNSWEKLEENSCGGGGKIEAEVKRSPHTSWNITRALSLHCMTYSWSSIVLYLYTDVYILDHRHLSTSARACARQWDSLSWKDLTLRVVRTSSWLISVNGF